MNSRRSFIWRMGAGASAAIASTAGMAEVAPVAAADPALKAALLEEEKALRQFQQAFEHAIDRGSFDEVIGLFTDDAQVVFNGGVFRGRTGVARLFGGHFRAARTGRRMEVAPGFEVAADQQQDGVAVAADRLSAQATFPFSIQVGRLLDSERSLAAMARVHGEGVQTWWEGGLYRVAWRRAEVAGLWCIDRLEYDTMSRADYRTGRSYAGPMAVARFDRLFPLDEHGPDALVQPDGADLTTSGNPALTC